MLTGYWAGRCYQTDSMEVGVRRVESYTRPLCPVMHWFESYLLYQCLDMRFHSPATKPPDRDVCVGDLVVVSVDESFPADLVTVLRARHRLPLLTSGLALLLDAMHSFLYFVVRCCSILPARTVPRTVRDGEGSLCHSPTRSVRILSSRH